MKTRLLAVLAFGLQLTAASFAADAATDFASAFAANQAASKAVIDKGNALITAFAPLAAENIKLKAQITQLAAQLAAEQAKSAALQKQIDTATADKTAAVTAARADFKTKLTAALNSM